MDIDWDYLEQELGPLSAKERKEVRRLARNDYTTEEILVYLAKGRDELYYYDYDYVPDTQYREYGQVHEEFWQVDCGIIEPCARATKTRINIPLPVWRQITAMTKNTETEWLGYLDFSVEGGAINVTSMTIPEQKATGSEVEPLTPVTGKGVIHAHPGGGKPAFSSTDNRTLNPNNEFSIVISRDLQMTAVAKQKLPCGATTLAPAEVVVEGVEDDTAFFQANKAKIRQVTYDYTYPAYPTKPKY